LIRGHNIYGLIELYDLKFQYATLLRNPYDRLITDWFWKYNSEINRKNLTFERYNAYSRFLEFVDRCDHLEFYIHHLGVLDFQNNQHFSIEECSKIPNLKAYRNAKTALAEKFNFVGIAEHMDLSLFAYSKIVHLDDLSNWTSFRHMKTPNRPQFDELPTRSKQAIIAKTKFDKLLYDEARNYFYEKFSKYELQSEYRKYYNDNTELTLVNSYELNSIDDPEADLKEQIVCLKDGLKIALYGIGGLCQNLVNTGCFDRFMLVAQFDDNIETYTKLSKTTYPIELIKDFNIDVLIITSSRLKSPYRDTAKRMKREFSLNFMII
jgi:hypothetical protein